MVKIKAANGEETKWDKDNLKKELESVGLSKKIAEELADRVGHKVVDGWTVRQVSEEAAVELKRLKEDIERALNYGSIVIHSQSETNPDRKMVKVRDPSKVADQIRYVMARPIVRMEKPELPSETRSGSSEDLEEKKCIDQQELRYRL
jgi:hypothetical protein